MHHQTGSLTVRVRPSRDGRAFRRVEISAQRAADSSMAICGKYLVSFGPSHNQGRRRKHTPKTGRPLCGGLDVPLDQNGASSRALGGEEEVLHLHVPHVSRLSHPDHDLGILRVHEEAASRGKLRPRLSH